MILLGSTPVIRYLVGMEKRCTKCGEMKPLDAFYAERRVSDGRMAACRSCMDDYSKSYQLAHPEKGRARQARYGAAHPDRVKARSAKWKREHPEEFRKYMAAYWKTHRKEKREYDATYNNAHPEVKVAGSARRRASKRGARAGCRKAYGIFVRWALTAKWIPCYWCHKDTRRGARHRDHIIPLSRGGADSVENLCVACPSCNLRKSKKTPFEFAGQGELHFVA